MPQRIINVDLDGVVYDFKGTSEKMIKKIYDYRTVDSSWYFWRDYGMTDSEWALMFRRGVESGEIWGQGDAIPGATHYLHKLNEDGFFIRIVTYRLVHKFAHADVIGSTVEWLDANYVPYHSIAFLGEEPKHSYLCDVAIDDNHQNWADYETHKIPCVLLDKKSIFRPGVRTWGEAYDQIKRLVGYSDVSDPRSVDEVRELQAGSPVQA